MIRPIVILALGAVLAAPAYAQRIELEGGNSSTLRLGPTDTEIERGVDGHLTVDIDQDGVGVEAGGGIDLGVDGTSRSVSRSISLGNTDGTSPSGQTPGAEAAPELPAPSNGATPSINSTVPLMPEPAIDGVLDEDICGDAAALASARQAFMDADSPDGISYIRSVNVQCAEAVDDALIGRLTARPEIRAGLDHMDVQAEDIVLARWTGDGGLVVYIAQ